MAEHAYQQNDAGIKAFLNGPELQEICTAIAEKAKADAIAISADFVDTGEYIDSFEVTSEKVQWTGRYPGPRSSAQLTNTSGHAAAVEWGNSHHPRARRVFGRVLDGLADDA